MELGESVAYKPIGIIRSEYTQAEETPIQPVYARDSKGHIELRAEYADGLQDIEGFSHIYLIYHLDRAGPARLVVKPFLLDAEKGVFATRAPGRPNPIGLSIVRLTGRDGNILYIEDLDILDGTPLLDIKPYVARFDRIESTRDCWQDEVDEETASKRGKRNFRDKSGS